MSGGLSATELALAAGAATAAGAGVNAYSANQQMRKQDSIAAQGIRNQSNLQAQAQAGVQKTIQKVGTDNAANEQANQQKQQAQYIDALRRAAPVQGAAQTDAPGASSRYAKGVVDAKAANNTFGGTQANLMSRTDAPQLTQIQDQQSIGDEASRLGLLNDTSNADNNLTKLQVQGVQQNPWLTAAGAVLQGVGSGASTYAGGMAGSKVGSAGKIAKGAVGTYADSGLGSSVAGLA